MLNVVLVSADPGLVALVRGFSDESIEFTLERLLDSKPSPFEMTRTLGTCFPDAIVLELRDPEYDVHHAKAIHKVAPKVPLVALAGKDVAGQAATIAERHPDSGILETLVWPFTVTAFEDALERAVHKNRALPLENLLAFLPGKAGSGASTVVYHTAGVLAKQLRKKPLVIEADLHSGLLGTMINAKPRRNVRQALQNAKQMEPGEWHHYVASAHGVDFVVADPAVKDQIPAWSHYYHLLRFALPKYDVVMVDLPEVVNNATAEVVRTARAVYVVSTPELPSLTLARHRCQELVHFGVDPSRIFAVLNRWHRHDISTSDAEEILKHPVAAVFQNDYRSIQRSLVDSKPLELGSELGAAYVGFAQKLMGQDAGSAKPAGLFARLRAS